MTDITVAASERTFVEMFDRLRDAFSFEAADTANLGPFSASYAIKFHLENGSVDLRADNTVRVAGLDLVWDRLFVSLGVDLPEFCVGGWCLIPTPFGCVLRLPKICAFSDNPDIIIPLDLSGLLRSEVSFIAALRTAYRVDPGRQPWMDYVDAENAGVPNKWQVFIDPESVDIDVFDIADIVGDVLESIVDSAVDAALWFLPDWARDMVKAFLGPVVDLVRLLLGIPDAIDEWLENLLGTSLGLLNVIATAVLDYLAAENPFEFEDPYPVLDASGGLIPVKIPITDFAVHVTDDEMVVEANVGP